MIRRAFDGKAAPMHYWVGRGTLCSLDNNVQQQENHSTNRDLVTCQYCKFQMALNRETTA